MKKKNSIILLLSLYFTIIMSPKTSPEDGSREIVYNNEYEYHSIIPYGYYDNKPIYIADSETMESIIDDDSTDIYIIDERDNRDPNMAVYNSYKITNDDDMKAIIKMLLKYEETYPSEWERSEISLFKEWNAHNTSYYSNYRRNSSYKVDFNNEDEEKYNSPLLSLFLGK